MEFLSVILNCVFLVAFSCFYVYFTTKVKNQATKEDISFITSQMESIKTSFAIHLEGVKAHNNLRMAAIDKRLAVHQEGYTLLRRALRNRQKENFWDTIFEAQEWWENNCLYLEPKAREAFWVATNQLCLNRDLIDERNKPWSDNDVKLINQT